MEKFICDQCENHCSICYEKTDNTLANVDGYLCPKGMLSLIGKLLPIHQKKEGMSDETEN